MVRRAKPSFYKIVIKPLHFHCTDVVWSFRWIQCFESVFGNRGGKWSSQESPRSSVGLECCPKAIEIPGASKDTVVF